MARSDDEVDDDSNEPRRIFILIENPRKNNNLGPILRCCAAFAVAQVVAIGYDKCATEGSQGAAKHVSIVAFPTLLQAVEHLRRPLEEGGCNCSSLVGLLGGVADAYGPMKVIHNEQHGIAYAQHSDAQRICRWSYPAQHQHFGLPETDTDGNIGLVICKRHRGLPIALARICDQFVHVPHVAIPIQDVPDGAAVLDAQSCFSITLHQLTSWLGYNQRKFEEHKFDLTRTTTIDPSRQARLRQERAAAREEASQEQREIEQSMLSDGPPAGVFGDGHTFGDGDY